MTSSTGNSTLLIDLPTELLCKIFEEVGRSDLLSLAKLCRRLNAVALRQYYKLVDLDVSKTIIYLCRKEVDILNALLLDISRPHFTYITTSFDAPNGPIVPRLYAYLAMLPPGSVEKLDIRFPFSPSRSPPKAFSNALSRLLGSPCLQRCGSLAFSDLDQTRFRRPATVRITSPPLRTLRSMEITHSAGRTPAGVREWLIRSANSSPLASISLYGSDLTTILEELHVPYLNRLHLSLSPNLSARGISSFISKHPFITHLHFYRCHWRNATVVAPDTLPNLEWLSGSPSIVLAFLSKSRRDRLMRISLEFDRPTKLRAKIIRLVRLISDHPRLSQLTFKFCHGADPDLWAEPWWWLEDGLQFPKISQIDIIFWLNNKQPTFSSIFTRWVGLFPDLKELNIEDSDLQVSHGFDLIQSFQGSRLGFSVYRLTCAGDRWIETGEMNPEDKLRRFVALKDVYCYSRSVKLRVIISSS